VTFGGLASLPVDVSTVSKVMGSIVDVCSKSSSNLVSASIFKKAIMNMIVGTGLGGAGDIVFAKVVENASLQGFKKISLLAESPLKEWIAEQGKKIVLSATGEIAERMMSACRGAFTWWQLLQIPVEVITSILIKSAGYDEIEAYGGSKLASVMTSMGIGTLIGGPFGLASSLALWIGAEVVAYLFRALFEKIYGDRFIGFFGESKTEKLVKRIYNWFNIKIEMGYYNGLEWMISYIDKGQGAKKILSTNPRNYFYSNMLFWKGKLLSKIFE
jgi:hypothetical protein